MMSRHFKAEQIRLINDLCQRLGFSVDSDLLESDSGVLQLLPQIQARLNALEEQDTYCDVEEIKTDSCPVIHLNQTINDRAGKAPTSSLDVDAAVKSIMRSMISSQVRRALADVVLDSSAASPTRSSRRADSGTLGSRQSSALVDKSLSSAITEIRSDTLLNEVVTSIVRAASEAVNETESHLNSSESIERDSCTSDSGLKKAKKKHRKARTAANSSESSRSSTSASASSGTSYSGSSFSGFPCFPSPHSRDDNRQSAKEGSDALSGALSNASASRTEASSKRLNAPERRRHEAMRRGLTAEAVAARLWEASSDSQSCARPLSNNSRHSEIIVSNSNMEARWRGRSLFERRQEFCWPIEDAYRYPYDNSQAVARDNWQFLNLRNPNCPAAARLNRIQRSEILLDRLLQRKMDAKNLDLNRGASSPFELYNGVTHPLGPAAAPCRAAFVGQAQPG